NFIIIIYIIESNNSLPNSLNEDALVSSLETIISESFEDFSASESLTNEHDVCKNNVNILEK
ncbi:23749_t:CDS:2, partial [Racocetra persica]